MYIFFLIFTLIIIVFAFVKNKIHIDITSFFHRSLPLKLGVFGVYCFTGKQGSGKTYSLNKFIRKHAKNKKIYSNVTLYNLDYVKLTSISQMLDLINETDCYIIYDEIFTFMTKSTKFNEDIKEFLNQMRKQRIIFLTTAQEWLDLPIEFRRSVRIQIECRTRPLGKLGGILFETYYDAYNMTWSNIDNEYVAPLISKKISKYEKRFMELYDTNERIKQLAK
jgi:nucleoside-triphosphatase THEP1